jgi:hypothetical protein
MEKQLMCPRTEICHVYKIYTDNTKDYNLGVIRVSTIEGKQFYSCRALSAVMGGELSEEDAGRLEGISGCLIPEQINRIIERRRADA